MIALLVCGADDNLLQERKRSVDVVGLTHSDTSRTSLLGSLIASQVNKMQFRGDNLLGLLDRRPTLDVNREDGVGT